MDGSPPDWDEDEDGEAGARGVPSAAAAAAAAAAAPATNEGFTFNAAAGITADVPRLSDLAADDEDDDGQQQPGLQQHAEDFTDDFGGPGANTP